MTTISHFYYNYYYKRVGILVSLFDLDMKYCFVVVLLTQDLKQLIVCQMHNK